MPVAIAPSYTQRSYSWTAWKSVRSTKDGNYQYDDDGVVYQIWFYDGPEVHMCTIWKGVVPDTVALAYSQEQNDLDKTDFEDNYKPTANRRLDHRTVDGKLCIANHPAESPRFTKFSFNWCDKTTWYMDATRVVAEEATDSGDHTTYTLAHEYVIDTYHGKISDEDYLIDADDNSYRVVVKVNDVAKTERDPHYGTGGDYEIDYDAGEVTFFSALDASDVVTVTYHYAGSSKFYLRPLAGRVLSLCRVEVQFTKDVVVNDTTVFAVYGTVGGQRTLLVQPTVYKTMFDWINDCDGNYPCLQAVSGSTWRGMTSDVITLPWNYLATIKLYSSIAMEIEVSLQHDEVFGGKSAAATFYCMCDPEV